MAHEQQSNPSLTRRLLSGVSVRLLALGFLMQGCGGEVTPVDVSQDADDAIAALTSAQAPPAVSLAVIKNGRVVYAKSAGKRKRHGSEDVEMSDAFHIGSNTKAMTALVAASLVDEGKLSWNSTIGSVLSGSIAFLPEYSSVTLEQLLSHTAGIASSVELPVWNTFNCTHASVRDERRRMANTVLSNKPESPPGSSFKYSNFGYVVAGAMFETITKQSWENLVGERVFEPLGMSSAGFGPPVSPERPHEPWGHDTVPTLADNPRALGPAGTVHVNLPDLIKYVSLYFEDDSGLNAETVVSPGSLEQIETPRINTYAMGWGVTATLEGDRTLYHNGSNGTFYSEIQIFPARRSAVIVLTNQGSEDVPTRVHEFRQQMVDLFAL